MGELAIGRNGGFGPVRRQEADRTEKSSAAPSPRRTAGPGHTVSDTLQQLMTRVTQAEGHARQSHRILQTGEAALAEVQDSLDRLADLAREASGGGSPDRGALQQELERLSREIDRILSGASAGGERLFLDSGAQETSLTALDRAAGEGLPSWLLRGAAQSGLTPEEMLSALGLDKNASGPDLLAALSGTTLEGNAAAGRLAALYLGAVIAARGTAGATDASAAAEGLRQLMEKVAQGMSPDQAVALLTNGAFTGMSDFQAQFTDGVIPGLESFLMNLLLSGVDPSVFQDSAALLALLTESQGVGEADLDVLMSLFSALDGSGDASAQAAPEAAPEAALSGQSAAPSSAPPAEATFGGAEVAGRDLSGVSYDEPSGLLTMGGEADTAVRGTSQAVLIRGSGAVTLRDAAVSTLTAAAPETRVLSAGPAALEEVRLNRGASLTLGGGPVRIGVLRGEGDNVLRLRDGAAVTLGREGRGELTVPVVMDGPASLAARAVSVSTPSGKAMGPVDLIWKTLLPGWSAVESLSVNGRQARMALAYPEAFQLWLPKGDPSQGAPVHTVVLRGRDGAGRPRTRYAYLRWNQQTGAFEEVSLYPNPFAVSGGEEGRDWIYEEETQTLRILTDQVSAVSGGLGLDARQKPFSGRIVLSDGLGPVRLTLSGAVCRVGEGCAFRLGEENEVTLILPSGEDNVFESGPGFAGISLGDGTSLTIDCSEPLGGERTPPGTLTASGKEGGAGIGRDSGAGRDRTCRIAVLGGVVAASGDGGGAGVGAGKRGAMGDISVSGGTVDASGGGGGAGVGGGLGAPAGDITLEGGRIAASALCHAAAIGAGVQGACGDILITGTARILKAQGGDPGADIGGCLFGGCGKVTVSGAADTGGARLWTRPGVSLRMGEDAVTLPQFRLSARAMGLDKLSLSTPEAAREAQAVLEADRRWVDRIQETYGSLYDRLEQSFAGLHSVRRYIGLVRNPGQAVALLEDMTQAIPQPAAQAARAHGKRGARELGQLLK